MKYCDNLNCDFPDEPLERVSDYRILDGAVICLGCYEAELEEANWWAANAELAEVDTVSRILSQR